MLDVSRVGCHVSRVGMLGIGVERIHFSPAEALSGEATDRADCADRFGRVAVLGDRVVDCWMFDVGVPSRPRWPARSVARAE